MSHAVKMLPSTLLPILSMMPDYCVPTYTTVVSDKEDQVPSPQDLLSWLDDIRLPVQEYYYCVCKKHAG